MSKNKYVGKKAQIEAVRRFSGVELPHTSTTYEVNNYIARKLFNTPQWKAYLDVFREVRNEKVEK